MRRGPFAVWLPDGVSGCAPAPGWHRPRPPKSPGGRGRLWRLSAAHAPAEVQARFLKSAPFAPRTRKTIVTARALRREFQAIRRRGYSLDNQRRRVPRGAGARPHRQGGGGARGHGAGGELSARQGEAASRRYPALCRYDLEPGRLGARRRGEARLGGAVLALLSTQRQL